MHTCMYALTRRDYSLMFLLSVPLSDLIWFCFGGSWYWLASEPELHSILLTFAQGLFFVVGWLAFVSFVFEIRSSYVASEGCLRFVNSA